MMPAAIHEETSGWIYSSMRDEAGFAEILPFFVDELPEKRTILRELRIADDYENLRREAHKLRGSAGGYGFQTLSTLAGQLEDSCKIVDSFRGAFFSASRPPAKSRRVGVISMWLIIAVDRTPRFGSYGLRTTNGTLSPPS